MPLHGIMREMTAINPQNERLKTINVELRTEAPPGLKS